MVFKGRKASLELSIQAIVIVVLAMTLLGLGLGFIRNMFKDIGGLSGDVSQQVREKILDDLITNDKKIAFPKTEIVIDKGGSEVLTVGIRNKQDQTLNYKMGFTSISGPDGNFAIGNELNSWFQYGTVKYELSAANSDVRNIRLSVPSSAKAGSYFLTFDVIELGDNPETSQKETDFESIYATKDIFIIVRG